MFDVFYFGKKPNIFRFEKVATDIKHAAQQSRTKFFWFLNGNNDYSTFNFDYIPPPWQEEFIHTWPSQWQSSGETYLAHVNTYGAYHYHLHNDIHVTRHPSMDNWEVPSYIDKSSIDFSWHPNPLDPPCVYHFETKWQWNRVGGPEYRVDGATDIKYLDTIIADTIPSRDNWYIPEWIDESSIDFSWYPNPTEPPYIYEFPVEWGWDNIGGPEYRIHGATEKKYVEFFVARTQPDATNFICSDTLSDSDNILRWRPNPTERPYIYIFGNQWYSPEIRESARYIIEGATELKYVDEIHATRLPDDSKFITYYPCEFDYSWEPEPGSPPYNYIFGNQHWSAETMPTVEFRMEGATEPKYINEISATLNPTTDNWHISTDIPFDFDYSWCPCPGDPVYNYVFGNQWYSAEEMATIEYRMSCATEMKFVAQQIATVLPMMERWDVPEEVDSSTIDFSWIPHPKDAPYIHHFGSEFQMSIGLTYTVPESTELKFEGEMPLKDTKFTPKLHVLDIFFMDKSNASAGTRFLRLQEKYPNIQKVRYVNGMVDTIKRCVARTTTTKFWVISSENVYDDFDFTWHAQPWQSYMTHVFGSQWQKWSDTYLINKYEFDRHISWAESMEQFPSLNFVKDQTVYVPDDLHDIYFIDHSNVQPTFDKLHAKHPRIRTTRYVEDYLNTFKRVISAATTEYVWIVSSLCEYPRFDFSWQPEPWQKEMIHVFPSGNQPRGDTFYIHVESFKKQMVELDLLDWFNVINYCEEQRVQRLPMPEKLYEGDDLISEIKKHDFVHPYTWFYTQNAALTVEPCMWAAKDKKIHSYSTGNSYVLVPKEAKTVIDTQVYDYPYISKARIVDEVELDIIYISNGEPDEEKWYNHLSETSGVDVKWVRNVNGRASAYKEAARLSTTPWFFTVFAKIEVESNFDWFWQPDYMQGPKHYIFNSKNPVNGLEYGHMGVIAYNKRLVMETVEWGLDFTLSKPHAVVPVLSGTAHYNQSEWMTWRTSSREVVKLKHSMATQPTVETEHRLRIWLDPNYLKPVEFAEWSVRGAKDAVEYYDSVNGDYNKLLKTFEWDWLKSYYESRYNK